jgi:hypothetical protein
MTGPALAVLAGRVTIRQLPAPRYDAGAREPAARPACRRVVRVVAILLLALGLGLLVAQPTAAAAWVRIAVAGPVVAEGPAKVTLTTFYLTEKLCAYDPQASPIVTGTWYSGSGTEPSEMSFSLIAYPAGQPNASIAIPLTHRAVNSPYYDGAVRFPSPGAWIVRVAEPHWGEAESEAERCGGARIDVQVAPAVTKGLAWPWLAGAALFGALVALLLAKSRARRL